ncbi:hypothetical protein [Streptomyces vinaceus]|uniref:hypothetical protein n=1 Tax=Streptomyces vinaceus TaxID=1960 RepID=UPI0036AE7602
MDEHDYERRYWPARIAVWALVNASGLALLAAGFTANAVLYGPHTSAWTSAWATAVAACVAYAVVEKAPLLATSAGMRRTVADWGREQADRVADWAGWEWDEDGR